MPYVANARIYSVKPVAASMWQELFARLTRESGVDLGMITRFRCRWPSCDRALIWKCPGPIHHAAVENFQHKLFICPLVQGDASVDDIAPQLRGSSGRPVRHCALGSLPLSCCRRTACRADRLPRSVWACVGKRWYQSGAGRTRILAFVRLRPRSDLMAASPYPCCAFSNFRSGSKSGHLDIDRANSARRTKSTRSRYIDRLTAASAPAARVVDDHDDILLISNLAILRPRAARRGRA
jgi:hypothetical protein